MWNTSDVWRCSCWEQRLLADGLRRFRKLLQIFSSFFLAIPIQANTSLGNGISETCVSQVTQDHYFDLREKYGEKNMLFCVKIYPKASLKIFIKKSSF